MTELPGKPQTRYVIREFDSLGYLAIYDTEEGCWLNGDTFRPKITKGKCEMCGKKVVPDK